MKMLEAYVSSLDYARLHTRDDHIFLLLLLFYLNIYVTLQAVWQLMYNSTHWWDSFYSMDYRELKLILFEELSTVSYLLRFAFYGV